MGLLGVSYAQTRILWIPRPYSSTVFPVTLEEQLCSQNGSFLGIFVCIRTEQAPLPCNSSKGCHSQLTPFFFCGKRFVRGIGAVKTNHGNQWSQRVHSKVSKFFFPDKIRRKQKLPMYFYQRVIDKFPCCTAEDTGCVIASWKLFHAPYLQLKFVWNAACASSCPTWCWLFIPSLRPLDVSACCGFFTLYTCTGL